MAKEQQVNLSDTKSGITTSNSTGLIELAPKPFAFIQTVGDVVGISQSHSTTVFLESNW